MARGVDGDPRRHMRGPERHRRRHAQSSHWLRRLRGDLPLGLFDRRQNVAASFQIGRSQLRQADLARRAVEKPLSEMRFKVHHQLAGHGPRHAETFRRLREMTALGDGDEDSHGV